MDDKMGFESGVMKPGTDAGTEECMSCDTSRIDMPTAVRELLGELQKAIDETSVDTLRTQVESFYSCLSSGLAGFDLGAGLPRFYITQDDEEFYLEWIFDFCRFGFDFYTEPSDSGWFALIRTDGDFHRHNSKFNGDYREAVDYALAVIGAADVRALPGTPARKAGRAGMGGYGRRATLQRPAASRMTYFRSTLK
ncbi:MAG: hypothetical protein Q4Q58_05175 [Thermoplasmata archaeon]|nr:hypothetical protein [Thermoplasmata archaeon]